MKKIWKRRDRMEKESGGVERKHFFLLLPLFLDKTLSRIRKNP
jgi:hypothetical protein